MVEAIERLENTPVSEFPERIAGRMAPLSEELAAVMTVWRDGEAGRLELLRRWLLFNHHEKGAEEVEQQCRLLLRRVKEWDGRARQEIIQRGPECRERIARDEPVEASDWFGPDMGEAYWEVMDVADVTVDYLRSLAWMLRGGTTAQNAGAASGSKYPRRFYKNQGVTDSALDHAADRGDVHPEETPSRLVYPFTECRELWTWLVDDPKFLQRQKKNEE